MRKFWITLTTIALTLSLILGGCSCNEKPLLSFTNDFSGGGGSINDATIGYTETLVYDVTYLEQFTENNAKIIKDASLNNVVSFSVAEGTYKSTLTILSSYPTEKPKSNILSDNGGAYDREIYYLETELTLPSSYVFKDGSASKSNEDTIKSKVYFANYGWSFAPIYAEIKVNCLVLKLNGNKAVTDYLNYSCETIYNVESYTITKTEKNDKGEVYKTEKQTYDYAYKSVIDNSQLLFALRNVTISQGSSISLPTVAPQYGQATPLKVANLNEVTLKANFNYNDKAVNEDMKVKCLSFAVDSENTRGASQFVKIQKESSENVLQNALLIEYVEPLVTYVTPTCMGALKYSLNSATINR